MDNTFGHPFPVILSFCLGVIILAMILAITGQIKATSSDLIISNDTGVDICKNLMNITDSDSDLNLNFTGISAHDDNHGRLICELYKLPSPSFDHTQNIIIKNNNEK